MTVRLAPACSYLSIYIGTDDYENVACLHRICLSFLLKQEPGRSIGLDSLLRGNDWGVGFIGTDNGIFVAVAGGVTHLFEPGHLFMGSGGVRCLKLIVVGLIRVAKIERAINVMKERAQVSPCWQAGNRVGLSDCYLATATRENDAIICALERYFKEIQSHDDITLLLWCDGSRPEYHNWLGASAMPMRSAL